MLGAKIFVRASKKRIISQTAASRGFLTLNRQSKVQKALKLQTSFTKSVTSKRAFCALYYEDMYKKYMHDPNSVPESWRLYFENKSAGSSTGAISGGDVNQLADAIASRLGGSSVSSGSSQNASEVARVLNLVRSYQTVGHEQANTDPLKLMETYGHVMQIGKKKKMNKQRLDYRFHGFTDEHLDKEYYIDSNYHRGFLAVKKNWKLRDLIDNLKKAYCGSIGVEYMHIQDVDECNWIRERFEEHVGDTPTEKELLHSYDRLCWAVTFGDFLQSKYNTQKRFGLEGCDSFIPGLKKTIDVLVEGGVETVTIGMPHRGRLNVLANVLRKPLDIIFQEFQGESKYQDEQLGKSGDVKYHLGTSYKRTYDDTGKSVEIHLLPNPSHLELVNPVVCGFVRANQHYSNDQERVRNAGIVVHGDAVSNTIFTLHLGFCRTRYLLRDYADGRLVQLHHWRNHSLRSKQPNWVHNYSN